MFFNALAIASLAAFLSTIAAAPVSSDSGISKRSPAPQVPSTVPVVDKTWPPIIHVDEVNYKGPGNIIKRQVDEEYGPVDEDYTPPPEDIFKYTLDEDYPPTDDEYPVKRQDEPVDDDYGPVDDGYSPPLDIIKYRIDEEEYRPTDDEYPVKRQERQVDEAHQP